MFVFAPDTDFLENKRQAQVEIGTAVTIRTDGWILDDAAATDKQIAGINELIGQHIENIVSPHRNLHIFGELIGQVSAPVEY